ncbi:cbb3-type cytochrome c oxidase subunit I, partial [Staphylococcus epidermidis]|uniref:cbb3-type cytochrome c oxidase subunit I n=1 Tax=Staphylococcus epidermidis TaxID=1282 RepID=UPI0037D9B790
MYLISPLLIFLPPPIHALILPTQLTIPHNKFFQTNHYNQLFTTHHLIIIIFIPIPFIFALSNVLIPLQLPPHNLPFPL